MLNPRRLSRLAVMIGLCCGAIVLAEMDYSRIPEDPRKMAQKVHGLKTGLSAAIKIAEDKTKARAGVAELVDRDGKMVAMIKLMSTDKLYEVTIDAANGAVLDTKENAMTPPSMPGDPVTGKPTTTPSGLMYYDIKVGAGDAPPSSSTQVTVHYSGWLVDGKKFDSSVDRGQPATFPLNGVISGWTEGVGSMKVGGKRKLLIPYALAYGEAGRPPTIPAKAMLIFDVELISIVK